MRSQDNQENSNELKLRVLKGTRDLFPEEQIIREKIQEVLVRNFRLYGYNPLETPILEYWDILASKYAGGVEILKETYKLTDQAARTLGLRYDLTVPLSRVIGMSPHLGMPFKRYEIGKVFRDGPVSSVRYREFSQCDVDVVGVKEQKADAEIISLTFRIFDELDLDVYMEINNRKLLSGILQDLGVPPSLLSLTILSVDKLKKVGTDGVKQELLEKGVQDNIIDQVFEVFTVEGSPWQVLDKLEGVGANPLIEEGISELKELFKLLEKNTLFDRITFLPSLARGLEIYTGTVFETFLKPPSSIKSSLAAGGRYDKIIGSFLQSERDYPAVGISFGLDTIFDAVSRKDSERERGSIARVFVIPINSTPEAFQIAEQLRDYGIFTDLDLSSRGLSKSLDFANRLGIPFVIFVGQRDLKMGKITLRDMRTGEEGLCTLEEATMTILEKKPGE